MDAEMLYGVGVSLVFAGILIILVAVVLLFVSGIRTSGSEKGKVKGGGAIIIGPFPIVFGTDKESIKTVLLLSIVLTILLAIITVIGYLVSR
ncbi:DUF131 domain-containing protein [Candidatus Bathyarchaeota archaeon]|nr:MAG: DUF131 domain-containing protein [Candidatus Bathyarchaeota archaeon]